MISEKINKWHVENCEILEPETSNFLEILEQDVSELKTVESNKAELANLIVEHQREISGWEEEVSSYKSSYYDLKECIETLTDDIIHEVSNIKQTIIDEYLYDLKDVDKKTYIEEKLRLYENNIDNHIWKFNSNNYHF